MKALPLWISVPITVAISLPFGLWLGEWSLPLWVTFVVWTEYFTLGAAPAALKTILPAYLCGVAAGTASVVVALVAHRLLGGAMLVAEGDVGWIVGLFVAFIPLIYVIRFLPFTQGEGGLPYFNGITMGLATYFVAGYTDYGGLSVSPDLDFLEPLVTAVPAVLGGLLGAFLGWFNVAIMGPFGVMQGSAEKSTEPSTLSRG
jgi:hypothetical protein